MSGICAMLRFDGDHADPRALRSMAEAAAHRGPDGIHAWQEGPAGLVHLALHMTPEDVAERQPLERGGLVVAADARIDNRDDLIPVLRAHRHLADADPGDAEIILAAHHHWGHDAPEHLIGDFAYALVDTRTGELFAARDAMGMRTLHVHATDRRVALATEIRQLLALPDVPAELFEPMLAAHLAGPYGEPGWTFYVGIEQLPPGHALLAGPSGRRTWRYWDVDPDARIRHRREEDYAEHLAELFGQAVAARMRTHKAIGTFLSGGVDSGAVASSLGRQRSGRPVHAYSWAFDDPALAGGDERHVSRHIVEHYGLTPHDVAADELWPLQGYPTHGPQRDGPYVHVYQAIFDRTFELARADGVGPLFAGDRGDEMVGDWVFDHPGMWRAGQWATLLGEIRAHAAWSRRSAPSIARHDLLMPLWDDLRRRSPRPPDDRQIGRRIPPYLRPEFVRAADLEATVGTSGAVAPPMETARRRRYERVFFFRGSRDPAFQERSAAGFGLAFVDPWSDRRIASFVLGVPTWVLQRPSEPKRLARRAMRSVIPEAAWREAGKREPTALFDRGFRERSRALVLDLMTDTELARRGYVDEEALRASFESFLDDGPVRHDFWWPLTLEMWLRRYWS